MSKVISKMDVEFQIDEAFTANINPKLIKEALGQTIQRFNKSTATTGSISVIITDNTTVRQLNHQHRGIDAPTDVLSFANSPDPDFPVVDPVANNHLGDIIIAYPVAEAQAAAAGHAALDEIILLAVHGALHLLGFDHDTPDNKGTMWAAQQQVMTDLGLVHIQPTEN